MKYGKFVLASIGLVTLLGLTTSLESRLAAEENSHLCAQDEMAYFSCTIGKSNKLLSFCGLADPGPTNDWLYYRFGKAGKIELDYPEKGVNASTVFKYEKTIRPGQGPDLPGLTAYSISFEREQHTYRLNYESTGDENRAALEITLPDKTQPITLPCKKILLNKLSDLESYGVFGR